MSKTTIKVVIGFFCVFITLGLIKGFQIYQAIKNGQFVPPPEAVTSFTAVEEEWNNLFHVVGSVRSVNGAMLSTQEPGSVTKILFEPGQLVEKGSLLVELDTSVEAAQLKGAVAYQSRMKKAFERAKSLKEKNAISNDEYDNTLAEYDRAASTAESLSASISRKRIVAPVTGRVGIRSVNVGDYIEAGTAIVSVHDLSKVYVNFSIPQRYANEVNKGAEVTVKADTGETFQGLVVAADPDVSVETRTVRVQAEINNDKEILRPGMFVSISLELKGSSKNVIVPISSISSAPYGDSVYLIVEKEDKTKVVEQQFVKVGATRGDFIQVLSGIKTGSEVVTSGLFKLRPGSAVLINNGVNNEFSTQFSKEPTPSDT